MADCKRLLVLKKLTELAETITTANGYEFNLVPDTDKGKRVVRGKLVVGAELPLPLLALVEDINPDRQPEPAGYLRKVEKFQLRVLVQGWADDNKEEPTDALYNFQADVGKAFARINTEGDEFYMLGGLVDAFYMEPGTVRPVLQPTELAFFWRRLFLTMTEYTAEPYRTD